MPPKGGCAGRQVHSPGHGHRDNHWGTRVSGARSHVGPRLLGRVAIGRSCWGARVSGQRGLELATKKEHGVGAHNNEEGRVRADEEDKARKKERVFWFFYLFCPLRGAVLPNGVLKRPPGELFVELERKILNLSRAKLDLSKVGQDGG